MIIKVLFLSLFVSFCTIPFPVSASHSVCIAPEDVLNNLKSRYPNIAVKSHYIDMDAVFYSKITNNFTTSLPPITADEIYVAVNNDFRSALVLFFHEGCGAGSRNIPRPLHQHIDALITGQEAEG